MPFDLTFDSGLIILIAAFDLFLLIRFFQFRRQIKVRGMVPGRLIMLGIVCAVVVIQACRGAFTQYTLAFNICAVLAVLLVAITPFRPFQRGDLLQCDAHPLEQDLLL